MEGRLRVVLLSVFLGLLACAPSAPTVPHPTFALSDASASTLRVVSISGEDLSSGSGVAVAANMVLTNRHVIANALHDGLNFQIYVFDNTAGFPRRVNAIIAQDPRLDLAILYVRGITSTPATLALAPPNQLDAVTALGFPASTDEIFNRLQDSVSATSGQVTAMDQGPLGELGPVALVMHTATINPGNSGGPLFNACGQLSGINTLRGNPSETSNVYVASSVLEIMPFLISYGVAVTMAPAVCETAPATVCTFDTTSLDATLAGSDLNEVDRAILSIPKNCPAELSAAWMRRAEIIGSLNVAFLQIAGTWRLPNDDCDDAIWLFQSGAALVGFNGTESQVENFTALASGSVSTRTIHPTGDGTYRYSLVEGRLKIENLGSNQAWELERCAGL